MSGGQIRKHERCKKSERFDYESEICIICGYRVFFKEDGQKTLFTGDKK